MKRKDQSNNDLGTVRYAVFALLISAALLSCSREITYPTVLVNNLGYSSKDNKIALVTDLDASYFSLENALSGVTELEGEIESVGDFAPQAGDFVREIDFSSLTKPGLYKIYLNTSSSSYSFTIDDTIYDQALAVVLNSFYLQRCGIQIDRGDWTHAACHLNEASFYGKKDKKADTSGGWHDAGDYNKFSTTHNFSLALLINQYLSAPHKYGDGQLNIPESGNGIPDIIDEIKWGITWLQKMQHSNGGVYHKVSIKKWSGENMPDQENNDQYIFDISSTGTAGAAGVFALGSTLFRSIDPEFSASLQNSAIKAWGFLTDNPILVPLGGFSNPPDVSGGEYGDSRDVDERLFASVELFKLTGNPLYLDYFHRNYNNFWNGSFYVASWQDLRNFAFYSYLSLDKNTTGIDANVYYDLKNMLDVYASKLLKRVNENPFKYVLNNDEFYWGSNSIALSYAIDLIHAYKFTNNLAYRKAALDQLHYILGRNPVGISFVTNLGTHSVQNPYHQFSALSDKDKPIPGMLVGGANYVTHLGGRAISDYQAKNYEDSFKNYMVNEPAINYTATLSYVLGYFSGQDQPIMQGTQ